MLMTYLKKKNIAVLSSWMFEQLHSSRTVKDEKKGFTIISDLQNNFDLSLFINE